MIKKIISIFIIFSLSAFNLLGYTYDNLVISYDANSTAEHVRIIQLTDNDKKIISTISKNYTFSDGSSTNLSLKWLKITKSKLDFKTNYKWIFSIIVNKIVNSINKKDLAPKKIYVLTTTISKLKNIKEKYTNHTNILSMTENNEKNTEKDRYQIILSKEPTLLDSVRWPPEFYIFNHGIKC